MKVMRIVSVLRPQEDRYSRCSFFFRVRFVTLVACLAVASSAPGKHQCLSPCRRNFLRTKSPEWNSLASSQNSSCKSFTPRILACEIILLVKRTLHTRTNGFLRGRINSSQKRFVIKAMILIEDIGEFCSTRKINPLKQFISCNCSFEQRSFLEFGFA